MTEQLQTEYTCKWCLDLSPVLRENDGIINIEKNSYVVVRPGHTLGWPSETEYYHLDCYEAMTAP